jgi:hypothetical protein
MITILSALLGFITPAMPRVLEYFQDKKDKEHELKIMQLQVENTQKTSASNLKAIAVKNKAKTAQTEIKKIYNYYSQHNDLVDKFNRCMSGVIALMFIGLFCVVEVMYFKILSANVNVMTLEMLDQLWTDQDYQIFALIVGHYFGNRNFQKGS